mgnify:CR=1 FL=1
MMVNIANPIYDSVFKYLMEDERIAKTLISALLKKEVVDVDMRRNEYTNGTRDKISMFRIDFGARIKEDDGSTKLVLIELQKTWLETETLRFRQYLGAQYANPENILKDCENDGYGIPMIAVYLLGHKVGDIEEPVLYVKHKALDYDGNHVTKGIPDPFVDSLIHDSIIVQIPRLRGHVNNRLDEVLSVFDQSQKEKGNHQVLSVDEDKFNGDLEMMHILHRLITAASDSKLRQDMNVEDEFFSAIENRDTAILQRDKKIASQQEILDSQDKKIATQDKKIATQDKKIATQDKKIATQDKKIASQDHEIASLKEEKERMGSKMRSMVKAMLDNGMTEETIAGILNISEEEVLRFAE